MKKTPNSLRFLLPVMFIVLALVALVGCSSSGPAVLTSSTAAAVAVAGNSIDILKDSFSPSTLSCKVGTAVTWTNKGSPQRVVASDMYVFNSYPLDVGKTYTFTFDKAGTYPYHCSESGPVTAVTLFRGKVIVEP
jgi:plastocyanin